MAAKLILSLDGELIQEYPLNKERMTLGRKSHNDVVISNLAVSSEHAAIITLQHDSFLEDLDSTNGLSVNGIPVKKYFLQNGDTIEIGKYKLKYLNDHVSQTSAAEFEKTMIMRAPLIKAAPAAEKSGETGHFQTMKSTALDAESLLKPVEMLPPIKTAAVTPTPAPPPVPPAAPAAKLAAIQILNGPNAGKDFDLVKGLTTLGKPGVQVAVLTRRPQGFFITHVEGASFPLVNGEALGAHPHALQDHDLIELAGIKMEFYFKS